MKIARLCLRVRNRRRLAEFYRERMGMRRFGPASTPEFGYDTAQCLLEFDEADVEPYRPANYDIYWKIGITLRNLDSAVHYLRQQGCRVSDPRQFRDIGYLCHISDPEGFTVELLQQGFEGHAQPAGPGHPVGGQATLAHLTLRVTDIAAARAFCEQDLGLRLMSIQNVEDLGFCLYFFGFGAEKLPKPRLEAVENREWLWSRAYTLLELQHVTSTGAEIRPPNADQAGFAAFSCLLGDTNRLRRVSEDEFSAPGH